jgi:hypothetical protein
MGNFTDGGESIEFALPANLLDLSATHNGHQGYLAGPNNTLRTDAVTMWLYTFCFSMGVVVDSLSNEISMITNQQPRFRNLDPVAPLPAQFPGAALVRPSMNVLGWRIGIPEALHTSWRSTYSSLGWSRDSQPNDLETDWLISPNSLRWISDRLSSIPEYKCVPASGLTATTAGHFVQGYTFTPPKIDLAGLIPVQTDRYSRRVKLALESARIVPPDVISPAFAFALRITRTSPQGNHLGLAAPWFPLAANGNHVDIPPMSRLVENVHLAMGPRTLAIAAFSTASEQRSRLLPFLYS